MCLHRKLLFLTFLVITLNALLWVYMVPIWHFPDEQAHFAQVAFLSEKKRNPEGNELDLTAEIYTAEELLGTKRDNLGNNKFTFHPEYRIEYTDSLTGKYEASIAALTQSSAKSQLIYKEASRYPPLYYLPATLLYRLFYNSNLFVRIYAIRFWSVVLFVGTIFLTYQIGKLLFFESFFLRLLLTLLVGFQPMMVFSNVGVNSDALGNFIFTFFLYLAIKLIARGINLSGFLLMLLIITLSFYTKPQFILILPISALLFLFLLLHDFKKSRKKSLFYLIAVFFASVFYVSRSFSYGSYSLINQFIKNLNIGSLIKYTFEYTLSHTYREVLPWYWGIYDWLGVTYPRTVHRIINLILLFSGLGFFRFIFTKKITTVIKIRKYQAGIFLTITSVWFYLSIAFFDWFWWYTQTFQLGVQGRYFFPTISVQMLMLVIGWRELTTKILNLKLLAMKILGILMLSLNFYALYLIARTYFDLSNFSTFIIQASQYKPLFVKGFGLSGLIVLTIITTSIFLIEYIRYPHEKATTSGR